MNISGSSALVTGGASGLGEATVRRLAAMGAHVVILDRDAQRGEKLAAEIGCAFVPTDVTDPSQVQAAIDRASSLGPLRAAVSCAGVAWAARTLHKDGSPHDYDAFRTTIQINLVGTF